MFNPYSLFIYKPHVKNYEISAFYTYFMFLRRKRGHKKICPATLGKEIYYLYHYKKNWKYKFKPRYSTCCIRLDCWLFDTFHVSNSFLFSIFWIRLSKKWDNSNCYWKNDKRNLSVRMQDFAPFIPKFLWPFSCPQTPAEYLPQGGRYELFCDP